MIFVSLLLVAALKIRTPKSPMKKVLLLAFAFSCLCVLVPAQTRQQTKSQAAPASCVAQSCAFLDPTLAPEQRAHDLVARMTLTEKVSQTVNHAVAIPRLGVEEYDWWSEGLHGVARNGVATNFPQSIGLAASFDLPLMRQVADVIGIEGRAKYEEAQRRGEHLRFSSLTFWSPNVNVFRDPRWGRGQETFGEDPFLSARMGVEFVKGLQGDDPRTYRLIATPKHYAVHSGPESTRHHFNAAISDHDLEDTYLPAFRATIVDGKAASIMCAYNAIDGKPACASEMLLKDHLRTAWGFTGFVVSDCDAVADVYRGHHYAADDVGASVASLRSGTDLDCGSAYKALSKAVTTGVLTEAELNMVLERLFTARIRLGMFDPPGSSPYTALSMRDVDTAASDELALKAAREAMVLLKNDGLLPLAVGKRKIAVVGPTADLLESVEGNYNGEPSHPITPLAGMQAQFGADAILYAPGSIVADGTPAPIPAEYLRTAEHTPGLKAEFFRDATFTGEPLATRTDARINFDWNRVAPIAGVGDRNFAVRWTGEFVPPVAGDYKLSFHCMKPTAVFDPGPGAVETKQPQARCRLYVDGQLATMNSHTNPEFTLHAKDGKPHAIRIEYDHSSEDRFCDFEWQPQAQPMLDRAVDVARKADVVVAFVGLSPNVEGEEMPVHSAEFDGGDRVEIALPRAQEHLLEALAATGKPMVVVYTSGSAVSSAAAERSARAILMAWYPGQQGGRAIAETLTGVNNPAGRLPVTIYKSVQDLPAFDDYSMANRTYRYFTGEPLYGFGFGLSYSSFRYDMATLSKSSINAGESVDVHVKVQNTSALAGDEVAELYVRAPEQPGAPRFSLQGFERVHLAAGEAKVVTFQVDARQLSTVDATGHRAVRAGTYTFYAGGSQPRQLTAAAGVTLEVKGSVELPR
jgi:beta-glucosidase